MRAIKNFIKWFIGLFTKPKPFIESIIEQIQEPDPEPKQQLHKQHTNRKATRGRRLQVVNMGNINKHIYHA
jgi:hypothetical protein